MFGMGSSSIFAIPTALDELQEKNLQKELAAFMPAPLNPKREAELSTSCLRYWITLKLEPHHMRFALNGLGIFRKSWINIKAPKIIITNIDRKNIKLEVKQRPSSCGGN